MRTTACVAGAALALALSAAKGEEAAPPVPKHVQIEMSDHLVGGIVGRTPGWTRVSIVKTPKSDSVVIVVTREVGRGERREETAQGAFTAEEFAAFWKEIRDVFDLPTADPPGCDDVYRQATALSVLTKDDGEPRRWQHAFPTGCVPGGESKTRPTAEQVERFRAIVTRIRAAADQEAPRPAEGK